MKDNDILDRKQLAGKKTYFLPVTWTYLSNGMNAYEQADYLSASIFFAVFTESVLKDIVREGNLSNVKTDQELGGITMSLKRYVLESNAPESKGNLSKNVGIIGDFRPVFAGYFQTILSLYYFPAKICLFIICSYFSATS